MEIDSKKENNINTEVKRNSKRKVTYQMAK